MHLVHTWIPTALIVSQRPTLGTGIPLTSSWRSCRQDPVLLYPGSNGLVCIALSSDQSRSICALTLTVRHEQHVFSSRVVSWLLLVRWNTREPLSRALQKLSLKHPATISVCVGVNFDFAKLQLCSIKSAFTMQIES